MSINPIFFVIFDYFVIRYRNANNLQWRWHRASSGILFLTSFNTFYMSYAKMMKWNKQHRKGTKQPCLFHTTDKPTFTPSIAYLDKYFAYRERCEAQGIEPKECEEYYYNRN